MNDENTLYQKTDELDTAFRGVLGVTGDTTTLVFADQDITMNAIGTHGLNPLDQLGHKPFADQDVEGLLLEMPRNEFFGGEESRTFQTELRKDVNLFMLLKTVSEGFEVTLDQHHIFLEGFETEEVQHPFKDQPTLKITPILGS